MAQVYVSIGSNIEPLQHVRNAIASLQQRYGHLLISSVYESSAVGFTGDNFYNLVVRLETTEDVFSINQVLHEIEQANGRFRNGKRFGARTLDLDLLLYDDWVLQKNGLTLPRDEITRYAFVLLPLAEIAPEVRHPVMGESYAKLWEQFDKSQQQLWQVAVDVFG